MDAEDDQYLEDEEELEAGSDPLGATPAPRAFIEVDEADPARFPYHKSLAVAAKAANSQNAFIVLQAMMAKGLTPGPKAWHAVVAATVKDPSMSRSQALQAGMEAAARAFRSGIRLEAQTYLLLISAHLLERNLKEAVMLHSHMERHEVPTADAWALLARSLFTLEHPEALRFYRMGASKGFLPSADLLEFALRAMLRDEERAESNVAEAQKELDRFNQGGRKLEARHVNLLLRALCNDPGLSEQAQKYLDDMRAGMYGLPRPDAQTLEMMAEGIATGASKGRRGGRGSAGPSSDSEDEDIAEQLSLISGLLAEYGLRPTPRYYALMVGNYLRAGSLDEAFESYLKMRASGFGRSAPSSLLSERTLTLLVQQLSEAGRPYDVLRVLMAMARDGRTLAFEEWPSCTVRDQSHLTLWIGRVKASPASAQAAASSSVLEPSSRAVRGGIQAALAEMERRKAEEEHEEVTEMDGVRIGRGKCAIDDDGAVISISKMNVRMLQAELKAKGVDFEGMKRKDMYKKVQQLRKEDTGLLEIAKRLKKEREKEEKRRRLMQILTPEQRLEEERRRKEAEAEEARREAEENPGAAEAEPEEEDRPFENRRFRMAFRSGTAETVRPSDYVPSRNAKTGSGRNVAVPLEVLETLEARRRIQQTFSGDEDFRKALSGEDGAEDEGLPGSLTIPGQDDDVLEEKSRVEGEGEGATLRLSEDDEEAIRLGNRGVSDWLDIGVHMSNSEGPLEHAYNILNASAKLGVRPRVGDWAALLDSLETANPPYPRAAFFVLRKLDRLSMETLYTRDEIQPLVQRAAACVLAAASSDRPRSRALEERLQAGETYAYIARAGLAGLDKGTLDGLKKIYLQLIAEKAMPFDPIVTPLATDNTELSEEEFLKRLIRPRVLEDEGTAGGEGEDLPEGVSGEQDATEGPGSKEDVDL